MQHSPLRCNLNNQDSLIIPIVLIRPSAQFVIEIEGKLLVLEVKEARITPIEPKGESKDAA